MKKWIGLLLSLTLLACCLPALGTQAAPDAASQQTITVGVATPMSGYFFTDMWGDNTVDMDVRSMLHGYGTIVWKAAGEYGLDETVAANMAATDDAQGNRTYTFTLANDLRYNDGTPITAADYVFSILLQSDALIPQLGGMNTNYSHLIGFNEYVSGQGAFRGVRLLDPYSFSLTVPSTALPYFYELTYAAVEPAPIHVIAPDYAVMDDGEGAYLTVSDPNDANQRVAGKLTLELLEKTLTAENGYVHQPRVTSGPYQLDTYSAAENTVTLAINPLYKGNYEGQKPEVAKIKVIPLPGDQAIAAFNNGQVQIINKLTDGDAIAQATQLQMDGSATVSNYLRSGYAFLAFACEKGVTADKDVRRALAMCIDREAFCNNLFTGYALPVNGYYGFGQWMASQSMEALEKYNDVSFHIDGARELLVNAGYTLNQNGGEYQQGDIRSKVIDGTLTPLSLKWAKTKSRAADLLSEQLTKACEELGIELSITEMTFPEMLKQYYRQNGTRDYDLFFLSDNFGHVFDPYLTYQTGDAWQGVFNTSGLKDEALMRAAQNLRRVEADNVAGYQEMWLTFQDAWHEVMPTAPIYSNVYFDVCIPTLYNYAANSNFGFGSAILYATFTEPVEEVVPVDETATTTEDELVIE